jgi:hypothetical protein
VKVTYKYLEDSCVVIVICIEDRETSALQSSWADSMLLIRWTLGSVLFLCSFAAMMGPVAYVQHLASGPRLPFTAAYFGSIGLTLYFAIGVSQKQCRLPHRATLRCRHPYIDSLYANPQRSFVVPSLRYPAPSSKS